MQTTKEVRELGTRVVKECRFRNVKVKFGRTNGEPVLHLFKGRTETHPAESVTIPAREGEWMAHPWNRYTKNFEEEAEDA